MRVHRGEAVAVLEVLEGDRFDKRGLAGAGLTNDVEVREPVFVF
jgi:hypothetical protein